MLKTIPTHQVIIGMHIHALNGAWVDHPFWKTSFVLSDIQDLKKLRSSVIKEVVIDISKGLDVPEPSTVLAKEEQVSIEVPNNPTVKDEKSPAKVGKTTIA
ncbi:MAG: phosphodiesterase, partial [Methylophilales bacterium 16-45-7]